MRTLPYYTGINLQDTKSKNRLISANKNIEKLIKVSTLGTQGPHMQGSKSKAPYLHLALGPC